jgi:hypothetical protein
MKKKDTKFIQAIPDLLIMLTHDVNQGKTNDGDSTAPFVSLFNLARALNPRHRTRQICCLERYAKAGAS